MIVIVLVAMLSCSLIAIGAFRYLCVNESGQPAKSPDGRYVVITHYSDCGGAAGSPFLTVTIEDRRQRQWIFWRHVRETVFSSKALLNNVDVRWQSSRELVIQYSRSRYLVVYSQDTRWRDITIIYEPVDRQP